MKSKKILFLGAAILFLGACGQEKTTDTTVKTEKVEKPVVEEKVPFVPAVFPADTIHFTCAAEVKMKAPLTIKYTNPVGATSNDQYWVAIVPKDSPEGEWGVWKMVDPESTTSELMAPETAGDYEVRLHNSYPALSCHMIQSTPLKVK